MMSLFPMAVITLFQQDHLGLSMAEIMTVQAVFGASLALFEFPSGYLADRIGYRPTLLLAATTSIVGWTLYSLAFDFWSVLLAEASLGLALSLVSGTTSALLYEPLLHEGREAEFSRWFGRMRFFGQMSEGSAALVAGLLFAWWVRLPFVAMIGVWVLDLVVCALLVETPTVRRRVDAPWAHVRSLVHFVAVRAPRLRALFALAVVLGLASFIPVWLVALYARDAGVPVSWIGPIWAAANYVVALGAITSDRVQRRIGLIPLLSLCTLLITTGYLGMGATQAVWGFVFYFAFNLSRGLSSPALAHAEQREIPSGDRASLASLRSLLFRLSFTLAGPIIGLAIDAQGQHVVLLSLGFALGGLCGIALLWLARVVARTRPGHPEEGSRTRPA